MIGGGGQRIVAGMKDKKVEEEMGRSRGWRLLSMWAGGVP